MEEKRVVYFKKRGAIVSDWLALQKRLPGSLSCPIELAIDVHVLEFSAHVNGLEPTKWAEFWLKKGDKRAKTLGTYFPVADIAMETKITKRNARKNFHKEVQANERNLKKKIKRSAQAWSNSML